MTTNIDVKILNEDMPVWRPVKAVCLKENIFIFTSEIYTQ